MIELEKRDKVMKGMDTFLGDKCSMFTRDCYALDCPYAGNDCMIEIIRDAYEVLKAQEPRLLQAADFQREDADIGGAIPCWKETRSPTRRNGWAVIVYGKWLADAGIARYWSEKPTQAQMENTPWLTEEE